MKNFIWVAFCKVLTKAIKFKDMGKQLAKLKLRSILSKKNTVWCFK